MWNEKQGLKKKEMSTKVNCLIVFVCFFFPLINVHPIDKKNGSNFISTAQIMVTGARKMARSC